MKVALLLLLLFYSTLSVSGVADHQSAENQKSELPLIDESTLKPKRQNDPAKDVELTNIPNEQQPQNIFPINQNQPVFYSPFGYPQQPSFYPNFFQPPQVTFPNQNLILQSNGRQFLVQPLGDHQRVIERNGKQYLLQSVGPQVQPTVANTGKLLVNSGDKKFEVEQLPVSNQFLQSAVGAAAAQLTNLPFGQLGFEQTYSRANQAGYGLYPPTPTVEGQQGFFAGSRLAPFLAGAIQPSFKRDAQKENPIK